MGRKNNCMDKLARLRTRTWLQWGNLMKESESLQIAAQNNAIRTNYIKAKIDKTQQNCKSRLYEERDKITNYIISEYNKLNQKEYKTRYN